MQQVERGQAWARRYNPIRLAVEHDALCLEVIKRQGTDPILPAISVHNPQVCNIAPQDVQASKDYTERVQHYLAQLGIDEMVMLRALDICEFSFGYTRVGSMPSTTEKDLEMPVCLRAFDYVERNKRPIYVLEQKNEGFYIRLNEARVIDWLVRNRLGDDLPLLGDKRIGGLLIEKYVDFGRFLEDYRERTAESRTPSLTTELYISPATHDSPSFRPLCCRVLRSGTWINRRIYFSGRSSLSGLSPGHDTRSWQPLRHVA